MNDPLVIAIDGPSGSGKSSTARGVAERLGIAYLDTGSMYRAFTLYCLDNDIDPTDSTQVAAGLADFQLKIDPSPTHFAVHIGGIDVTDQLHSTRISGQVHRFARVQSIRDFLITIMRRIINEESRIVVEGRDITTVVAPEAQVRVLLVADAQARIRRRSLQLNGAADLETVTQQVIGRAASDLQVNDFERPAPGVHLIDNYPLTLSQAIDAVIALL